MDSARSHPIQAIPKHFQKLLQVSIYPSIYLSVYLGRVCEILTLCVVGIRSALTHSRSISLSLALAWFAWLIGCIQVSNEKGSAGQWVAATRAISRIWLDYPSLSCTIVLQQARNYHVSVATQLPKVLPTCRLSLSLACVSRVHSHRPRTRLLAIQLSRSKYEEVIGNFLRIIALFVECNATVLQRRLSTVVSGSASSSSASSLAAASASAAAAAAALANARLHSATEPGRHVGAQRHLGIPVRNLLAQPFLNVRKQSSKRARERSYVISAFLWSWSVEPWSVCARVS